jgi:FeS assembly protein IscX
MPALTWDDSEKIALALLSKFPAQDPLQVRFTDLRDWVIHLDSFAGDPAGSSESALETIQIAWWEEWKEAHA